MAMASTVWKGQLTFGLVSLPVRLYRAARKERVQMHYVAPVEEAAEEEVAPEKPRAGLRLVSAEREEEEPEAAETPVTPVSRVSSVKRAEMLKGHEVAPEQYVTFTPKELKALRPETSSEMQIIRSVRLEEIDPVYFDASYYVAPDKGGERAYALLYGALKESGYVALATVAMHGREHVVTIRPGGKGLLAHTMFYADEIRGESEFDSGAAFDSDATGVQPKELQLARTFIEAIAAPFHPQEFKDTQRERLKGLIAEKVARKEVAPSRGSDKEAAGDVVAGDIMEALRKSIEKMQTPPKREAGTEKAKGTAKKRKA